MTIFVEIFESQAFIILLIGNCAVQLTNISFISISFDFVCELTYPIGESITGGLLMTSSQFSGIFAVYVSGFFMDSFPQQRYLTNVFASFILLISIYAMNKVEGKIYIFIHYFRKFNKRPN
jgi:hypothetical protein